MNNIALSPQEYRHKSLTIWGNGKNRKTYIHIIIIFKIKLKSDEQDEEGANNWDSEERC
jgi:hypothetical protein